MTYIADYWYELWNLYRGILCMTVRVTISFTQELIRMICVCILLASVPFVPLFFVVGTAYQYLYDALEGHVERD